jgi:hypothetical protein
VNQDFGMFCPMPGVTLCCWCDTGFVQTLVVGGDTFPDEVNGRINHGGDSTTFFNENEWGSQSNVPAFVKLPKLFADSSQGSPKLRHGRKFTKNALGRPRKRPNGTLLQVALPFAIMNRMSTNTKKSSGMNPHDRFARKTMGDPLIAADLLRHYTDPIVGNYVDLDHLRAEPTHNFGKGFQELVKDITFTSHLIDERGKAEVLIVAEHKSKPEPFVLLQLLVYLVLSWYQRWCDAGRPQSTREFRLPLPILVVLYNGKEQWENDPDLKSLVSSIPPELEPFVPAIKVLFIRLHQFDKRHLPGRPETRAVVESMIRATEGTFVAGLESVIGHFKGLSLDSRIEELVGDIIRYCDLTEEVTDDDVDKAITNVIKGQEGIRMSQTARKGIWTTGYEIGIAEGKADAVLKVLRARFTEVPKATEDAIRQMRDPVALDSWTAYAVTCESMDEFAAALK